MGLQKDEGLVSKLSLEWVGNQHMEHDQKSVRLGLSMVGKSKRIGMRSWGSEQMGESRESEPGEYLFPCRQEKLHLGRGGSQEWGMWDARAIGKDGNMVMTVGSLGSAWSGLRSCKPKVKTGPKEVPHPHHAPAMS